VAADTGAGVGAPNAKGLAGFSAGFGAAEKSKGLFEVVGAGADEKSKGFFFGGSGAAGAGDGVLAGAPNENGEAAGCGVGAAIAGAAPNEKAGGANDAGAGAGDGVGAGAAVGTGAGAEGAPNEKGGAGDRATGFSAGWLAANENGETDGFGASTAGLGTWGAGSVFSTTGAGVAGFPNEKVGAGVLSGLLAPREKGKTGALDPLVLLVPMLANGLEPVSAGFPKENPDPLAAANTGLAAGSLDFSGGGGALSVGFPNENGDALSAAGLAADDETPMLANTETPSAALGAGAVRAGAGAGGAGALPHLGTSGTLSSGLLNPPLKPTKGFWTLSISVLPPAFSLKKAAFGGGSSVLGAANGVNVRIGVGVDLAGTGIGETTSIVESGLSCSAALRAGT
jgi:hypothetical protein